MALLVKEKKALEQLEQSFINYFSIVIGNPEIAEDIDTTKTPEERLLQLATLLDGSY